jgi:hypothetical protein
MDKWPRLKRTVQQNPKYEGYLKIEKGGHGSTYFTPNPPSSLDKQTWSQATEVYLMLNPLPVQRKSLRAHTTCFTMALGKINMEDQYT